MPSRLPCNVLVLGMGLCSFHLRVHMCVTDATGNAYDGDFSAQSTPVSLANATVTVVRGPVVSVVYQRVSSTLVHAVRLFNCTGCAFLESEVGPRFPHLD